MRFGSGPKPTQWQKDWADAVFWRGYACGTAVLALAIIVTITVLRGAFGW